MINVLIDTISSIVFFSLIKNNDPNLAVLSCAEYTLLELNLDILKCPTQARTRVIDESEASSIGLRLN